MNCKYCQQAAKIFRKDLNSIKPWSDIIIEVIKVVPVSRRSKATKKIITTEKIKGLVNELPNCPECHNPIGAVQTQFKGFYNDSNVLSRKDKHVHVCGSCDWASEEFDGTYVSRKDFLVGERK